MKPELMWLGKVIETARKEKNLSVAELARLSGVNRNVIDRIESGGCTPTLPTLTTLAEAMGTHADVLQRRARMSLARVKVATETHLAR